jgi:hypothetical protein
MHVQTINVLSYSIDYYHFIVIKHCGIAKVDLFNIFSSHLFGKIVYPPFYLRQFLYYIIHKNMSCPT